MSKRFYALLALLLLAAACQPASPVGVIPSPVPFPTMTPGRTIRGALSTVEALPLDGSNLANPATAVALANRPTATPDFSACPAPAESTPGAKPATGRAVIDEITRFLTGGGALTVLQTTLEEDWGLLGGNGYIRSDVDLTGEGVPEVLIGYTDPESAGTLLILGCANRRYVSRYEAVLDRPLPPEILWTADMNFDRRADLLFAAEFCSDDGLCGYRSQVITWKDDLGRFVNLLADAVISEDRPIIQDVDGDQVSELVVRQNNRGTAQTGPLRTGVFIYDWNGTVYTLSIVQLDPPRYRIQVVHEADRAFLRLDMQAAIPLYQLALTDDTLRNWIDDEPVILTSYIQYRLLLAYASVNDGRQIDTYQAMIQAFPDPANRPIYAILADTFWNALQITNSVTSACREVQEVAAAQPDAVALLNRYGSRSPTYSADDLCPF